MKNAKKILAIILVLSLFSMLAACGSAGGGEEASGDKPVVYFCISHMSNAWATTASDSMKAEAEAQGVDLTVLEAGKDINTQVGQIEMAVTNGADVIIIEPVSADGVLSAVKAAEDAGVRVIIYNQNISDPSIATAFVGVSNSDMGYMEMKLACETLGGSGNIALLLGPLGSEGQLGRSDGYDRALAEYPDVTVVFEEDGEWTTENGLKLVENWLSTGTTIDAVVSQNDNMALGAVKAFEDAGLAGTPAYGVDAVDDAIKAISEGRLTATIDQATPTQSKLAIEVAVKLAKGETVEKEYLATPTAIDSSNVADYLG